MILFILYLIGVIKAAKEIMVFKMWDSIFLYIKSNWFGDPFETWQNKYKKVDGLAFPNEPKFPFATTLLVFITDSYHSSNFLINILVLALIVNTKIPVYFDSLILTYIVYYSFDKLIFEIFFKYIFIMRTKSIFVFIVGLALIFIGESYQFMIDETFITPNFNWDTSKEGFWLIIAGFGTWIFSAIFILLKKFGLIKLKKEDEI